MNNDCDDYVVLNKSCTELCTTFDESFCCNYKLFFIDFREIDSDGDEMEELADSRDYTFRGYRLWYAVDITVEPAPPEKILELSCPCLVCSHDLLIIL